MTYICHHIIHRVRLCLNSKSCFSHVDRRILYLANFGTCNFFLLLLHFSTAHSNQNCHNMQNGIHVQQKKKRFKSSKSMFLCFLKLSKKNPIFAQIFAITLLCDKAAAISRLLFTFWGRRTRLQKLVSNE